MAGEAKVYPVHNNEFKFGTKGVTSSDEDMVMPADLENFAPSIDGTVEEWYAMDAKGWAKVGYDRKEAVIALKARDPWEILGMTILRGLHGNSGRML